MTGGVNATKDGRVSDRMKNYNAFWENKKFDQDQSVDTRVENYTEVVNGYYDGATQMYEYGWGKCFHFSRFNVGEPREQSFARHEHYLAHMMQLKPGMRVLDVGCGVGGPAREIAAFADVNVIGLNNNDFQIMRARQYTAEAKLEKQVQFVKGDFMKLAEQFGENSFDAVYAIEATVHAPSFEGVYGEIKKVLKPGGIFGVYEWCMTDEWDPSIPAHKELAHKIEYGNGIPCMRPIRDSIAAFNTVGLEILHQDDLADRDDPVTWYHTLEGDFSKTQTWGDMISTAKMTRPVRRFAQTLLWSLEKLRVVPQGTAQVGETLIMALLALVEGGRTKLFTPMLLVIARKPEA